MNNNQPPATQRMRKKWYRVEYLTTLTPPKSIEEIDDRYLPKGDDKEFKVDDLKVFKVSNQPPPEKQELCDCKCHCHTSNNNGYHAENHCICKPLLKQPCSHSTPHQDEGMGWEEEFDDIWKEGHRVYPNGGATFELQPTRVKNFIHELLAKDRQQFIKIKNKHIDAMFGTLDYKGFTDDILAILEGENE